MNVSLSASSNVATRVRLGTRGSALARWQAQWVSDRLTELGVEVEIVLITTHGDTNQGPLGETGATGLFTKEIQRALLDGQIDVAVHSLKDLPTDPVKGLVLAAIPLRESVADVLIASLGGTLETLPVGARIGTGSARRRSQILQRRPDLHIVEIRGNVDTRLRKVDEGEVDAIVLAEAGLNRLELSHRISQRLGPPLLMPAVGQGALGIETRDENVTIRSTLRRLDHAESNAAVRSERAMLHALRGGCLAPIGAWCRMETKELVLDGVVLSNDGRSRLAAQARGDIESAEQIGIETANRLLSQGAADLIRDARTQ